ncbi:hypothetical protein VST7929_02800 [Vibrio stylophorae]|uniref:Uncharacterized protein n=1 Tax=Vibrio stylophorae TaxID=659351 RepID=A0ABN8DYA9_9VIBR|nr:hypothetical protein [Vibrio stylophorae]CAH0535139.1 hypothetical protein VST7929_02800 [Vibrio stylophorae]
MPIIHCISCINPTQQQAIAQQIQGESAAMQFDENTLLTTLYGYDVYDLPSYLKASVRLRKALMSTWQQLNEQGIDLLLLFSAHTREQQGWLTQLAKDTGLQVQLHVPTQLDASPERCAIAKIKAQIYALGESFEMPVEGARIEVIRHE